MNPKRIYLTVDRMRALLNGNLNATEVLAGMDYELDVLKKHVEANAPVRIKVAVVADLLKRLKMVAMDSTTTDGLGSGHRIKQDLSTALDSIAQLGEEIS